MSKEKIRDLECQICKVQEAVSCRGTGRRLCKCFKDAPASASDRILSKRTTGEIVWAEPAPEPAPRDVVYANQRDSAIALSAVNPTAQLNFSRATVNTTDSYEPLQGVYTVPVVEAGDPKFGFGVIVQALATVSQQNTFTVAGNFALTPRLTAVLRNRSRDRVLAQSTVDWYASQFLAPMQSFCISQARTLSLEFVGDLQELGAGDEIVVELSAANLPNGRIDIQFRDEPCALGTTSFRSGEVGR